MRQLVDGTDSTSTCNARFVDAENKWSNTSVPLPMLALRSYQKLSKAPRPDDPSWWWSVWNWIRPLCACQKKQQLMHTKDISLTSATWPRQKCSQLVPYGHKKQVYRCSKNQLTVLLRAARGAHLAAEYNNNLTRFNPPPTTPSGLQNSKTTTPNIIQLDSF